MFRQLQKEYRQGVQAAAKGVAIGVQAKVERQSVAVGEAVAAAGLGQAGRRIRRMMGNRCSTT